MENIMSHRKESYARVKNYSGKDRLANYLSIKDSCTVIDYKTSTKLTN